MSKLHENVIHDDIFSSWVFSTLQSSASSAGHLVYNSSKSSTFQELRGSAFNITYGDGSGAKGIVGTETVNIGGATVTKQAVELATSVSVHFVDDTNSDGMLGLAFSTINTGKLVMETAKGSASAEIERALIFVVGACQSNQCGRTPSSIMRSRVSPSQSSPLI
jgi:hypothetical protein